MSAPMKRAITLLAAVAALGLQAAAAAESPSKVVVELFTSQACPACPPAEAYLRDLAQRDDVIALEYHIDYYDYAGWKDPYGRSIHTRRWQTYARSLGARYEYTPFMVVGGVSHVVGSKRPQVEGRIRTVRSGLTAAPQLTVETRPREAVIAVDGNRPIGAYDIVLVTYDREHRTRITAGENRGMFLVEANVVRGFERVGRWTGAPVVLTVPLDRMPEDGGCAVLLQRAGGGPIAAAATFSLPR
jgi:hypothetical protein